MFGECKIRIYPYSEYGPQAVARQEFARAPDHVHFFLRSHPWFLLCGRLGRFVIVGAHAVDVVALADPSVGDRAERSVVPAGAGGGN